MKHRLFIMFTAVSAALLFATTFLLCRSFVVHDEFLIAGQTLFVMASDSGRLEFASASCSTATAGPISGALGLTRGVPTIYSNRIKLIYNPLQPGRGDLTYHQIGEQEWTYYYYGNVIPSDPKELGPSPLINDIVGLTIPSWITMLILAVLPAVWGWKRWGRRYEWVTYSPEHAPEIR